MARRLSSNDTMGAGTSRRAFLLQVRAALVASGISACGDASSPAGPGVVDGSSEGDATPPPDDAFADAVLAPIPAPDPPPFDDDPFTLGVASGDPLHDRVVLWTRLAIDPLGEGDEMPAEDVPVLWEVFDAPDATTPVREGWAWAVARFAHSVHVDVRGLVPDRFYWYRFRVGDQWQSPLGRTRTFPAPDAQPERLRIALACCQKYWSGWYSAYDHLSAMDLHAVVFLGDYIYESGGEPEVEGRRAIDLDRVTDLAGFRRRYGGYRSDEQLQEAHRQHPWIVTWDDHEVSNDYGNLTLAPNRRRDGDAATIRAAGYQAWYEHMPVRLPEPEDPVDLAIYRSFPFGDLATLFVLDARQYRSDAACLSDQDVVPPCDDFFDAGRTMLGEEQEAWLLEGLGGSRTHWNLIAQQVYFGPLHGGYRLHNPDQWDGYLAARDRIMEVVRRPGSPSCMVLSGDVHAAGFGVLHEDLDDVTTRPVAVEVLTTSISSGGDAADGIARAAGALVRIIDSLHYFEARRRGFAVCDYTRERCEVTYYAVTTVSQPTADLSIDRRYRVEAQSLAWARVEEDEGPVEG